MKKDEIIKKLLKDSHEIGLVPTLCDMFGKSINVRIPFSAKDCDTDIDDLEFSPRAEHSLKRAGVFTVGGVIDLIENGELLRLRNLGKKTQSEIKTRILLFGYDSLTDTEKIRFFGDLLEMNAV